MAGQKVCNMNTCLPQLDEFTNWLWSEEAVEASEEMLSVV